MTETTEAPVETTETHSTELDTEAQPQPTESVDYTETDASGNYVNEAFAAYVSTVNAIVDERDPQSGVLTTEQIEAANEAYSALPDAKAKAAARKWTEQSMLNSVRDMEQTRAMAYYTVQEKRKVSSTSTPKPVAEPVDPTEDFVSRLVAYQLAFQTLASHVPDGVTVDQETWFGMVSKQTEALQAEREIYDAWYTGDKETRGEEPKVSPEVIAGAKLAYGRGGRLRKSAASSASTRKPFDGVRRNIARHIASAFADKNPGDWMSINEIVNHRSDEYGDEPPSAGAVSARLYPSGKECTLNTKDGVPVGPQDRDNKKGAVKLG